MGKNTQRRRMAKQMIKIDRAGASRSTALIDKELVKKIAEEREIK